MLRTILFSEIISIKTSFAVSNYYSSTDVQSGYSPVYIVAVAYIV